MRAFRWVTSPRCVSFIHKVGDYALEQVNAWAQGQFAPELSAKRTQGIAPFVVLLDGIIVA